ncbi:DUF3426 domain-containing protein [Glaciimonas sp. GG7]
MALATQCPHCQTTFRVANDQLKLRAGLVRCGTCREVFNGIEHLVRSAHSVAPGAASDFLANDTPIPKSPTITKHISEYFPATEKPLSDSAEAPSPEPIASFVPRFNPDAITAEENTYSSAAVASQNSSPITSVKKSPDVWHRPPVSPSFSDDDDPLQRMTLLQVASREPDDHDTPSSADENLAEDVELDRLIDELQNRQWPGQKSNSPDVIIATNTHVILGEVRDGVSVKNPSFIANPGDITAEPRFIAQAKRKQHVGGSFRTGMWIGSTLLLIALIGQASFTFRDHIAAHVPLLKPVLQRACNTLGCQINLPMAIDGLSIESNELQLIDPARNVFALSVLMRNRNSTVQAWPNIELTLNDANEKAIARRIFTPRDYLSETDATGATRIAQGFSRNTEYSAKLTFELSQLKASGYRVYLFYP